MAPFLHRLYCKNGAIVVIAVQAPQAIRSDNEKPPSWVK